MTQPKDDFVVKGTGYALIQDPNTGLYMARLAKLADMLVDIDFASEDIYGGDDLYPFDTIDKDRTATISFTNNIFDLAMLTATIGTSVNKGTVVTVPEFEEAHTIPAETDYTVELNYKDTVVADRMPIVRNAATGEYFTCGESADEGTYTYAAGTLTFAVPDAGKNILVDYWYTVADGNNAPVLADDAIPAVEIWHKGTFKRYDGGITGLVTHIFQAKANGKLSIDGKRGTASSHKLDYKILNPGRADKKVVEFSTYVPA